MPVTVARGNEDGAALVLALAFLATFGLVISLVLGEGHVHIKTTHIAMANDDGVYAADAGIEYGIQRLRMSNTLCSFPLDDNETVGTITVNGRAVEVKCDNDWGHSVGADGWAIITRERSTSSLTTQGGVGNDNNVTKKVEGPIFAGGLANDVRLEVKNGDVFERMSTTPATCTTSADKPAGLQLIPAGLYGYGCVNVTDAQVPDPSHDLPPGGPPAAAQAPAPAPAGQGWEDVSGSCRRFYPGKYTGASLPNGKLPLLSQNYFVTGLYYFENVELDFRQTDSVAGARHPAEVNVNGYTPCSSDPAPHNANGTGVKWLFGGSTFLLVDNPSGHLELYTRLPPGALTDTGSSGAEGTDAISLMTVQAGSPAPWVATTRSYNPADTSLNQLHAVAAVGNGNTPALTIHGLVYVPTSFVNFSATNTSEAQIRGGIVAGRLHLQASASASGFAISVKTSPRVRRIVLTATAAPNGVGAPVVATAVVTISNEISRNVTVHNWRTK